MEDFGGLTILPGHGGHFVSNPEPLWVTGHLTGLGLKLALNNMHLGLSVNRQICSEGHLRITLAASRKGPGWLATEDGEAGFTTNTLGLWISEPLINN